MQVSRTLLVSIQEGFEGTFVGVLQGGIAVRVSFSVPVSRPLLGRLQLPLGSRLQHARGAAPRTQRCWPGLDHSPRAPPVRGWLGVAGKKEEIC